MIYINSLIVKENKGGFSEESDVDWLVSSMKGATEMKSIQEERYEYDKFVIGVAKKVQEMLIQSVFPILSLRKS